MKKSTLYMLAGVPGAGKSTAAKRLESQGVVWLTSDGIREELYGSEEVQGSPSEVFGLMKERTRAALLAGQDVVYDACNLRGRYRRQFLEEDLAGISCTRVCLAVETPLEVCLQRNAARERHVPEHVIRRMANSWERPAYKEGWDLVLVFTPDSPKGEVLDRP